MNKAKKLNRGIISILLIAVMIFLPLNMVTNADTIEETTYNLVCVDGGRYLNVYAGTDKDGTKVCVWDNDGSKEQKFKIVSRGSGKYLFYPQSSSKGRVLDVNRGNSYKNPLKNGNKIDIWLPNDAPAQEWNITNKGDGKYTIELAALQGSVITADNPNKNNGSVSLQAYTGANNQLWYLQRVDKPNINDSKINDLASLLEKRLADFNSAAYNQDNPLKNYKGQCTWYCWGRAYEKTGIRLNTINGANTWISKLNTQGATIVRDPNKPRANSIAVDTSGNNGHVIYVEDVIGDTVYYTEANNPLDNVIDKDDGILKSKPIKDFAKKCNGYIYLN
jgi:surface antigen